MKIEDKFSELKGKKEGAYMPHLYYGDPSEKFSFKLIDTLVENGADLLELGIPFSDPTADGPTFQSACERALKNDVTPVKCIRVIKKLRDGGLKIPIIVTTYYNIPYVWGVKSFLIEVKNAGAQGLIIPNLPIDEASEILKIGRSIGLSIIFLVTPTTTEERLKKIIRAASGFIYIVNIEGVTGARKNLTNSTLKLIRKIREYTKIPLMAGFGISKREHARDVVSMGADGAITGSSIGEIYEKNLLNPEETLLELADFAREMKQGCIDGYRDRFSNK